MYMNKLPPKPTFFLSMYPTMTAHSIANRRYMHMVSFSGRLTGLRKMHDVKLCFSDEYYYDVRMYALKKQQKQNSRESICLAVCWNYEK